MKTFWELKESIIDIPRRTYAPAVFDKENTPNPVIKPSVISMIEKQLAEFEKEYPVLKYTLIGSILTKRYRKDADLDINILFDVPADKAEDERLRLSKKYLSSSNPDNIQGKLIPNTEHPVNYYFLTDEKTYDDQNGKADAVFDIKGQKFVKRPEDFVFDMDLYIDDFKDKVYAIDMGKGELERDLIDYKELMGLEPNEVKGLGKKISKVLGDISDELNDLADMYDDIDTERRAAFDSDMTPKQIKKFSIKNRLPKNVVYKMLEKYHYLTFLKKCKKIMDDGRVTDDEIKSLQKESAFMQTFLEFLDLEFLEEKIVVHQSKHLKFPDGSIGRISNKRAVVLSNRHSDNIKVYIDSDGDLTLDTGKGDKTFKNVDELVKYLNKEKMEYEGEDKINEMTGTGAVAGAGDDSETVPVDMKKKRKEVLKKFIQAQEDSKQKWSR